MRDLAFNGIARNSLQAASPRKGWTFSGADTEKLDGKA